VLSGALLVAACGSKPPPTPATPAQGGVAPGQPAGDGSKAAATAKEQQGFADAVTKYEALKGKTDAASCSTALDLWTRTANDNEKIVEARYNVGAVQEACGDLKGAESSYKKALEIKGQFAPALAGLGSIAAKQGNTQQAEQQATQALQLDPNNATAHRNLGQLQLANAIRARNVSAMSPEIVKHMRFALAQDSKDTAAYTALALVYYYEAIEKRNDKSKLELAQLVCNQAMQVSPNAASAYNVLGMVFLGKKNVSAALVNFRKATEIDPKLVEAYMNIGAVTLSFRDYAGAEAAFKKAIELSPQNVEAVVGLGVALRGQKKVEEAEAQYKAAEKIDARNCAVPFNLGLLYQDYKGASEMALKQAQTYYRDFVTRCASTQVAKAKDAEVRIKNIDETIDAIKNAAVLQKQAEDAAKRSEEEAKKAGGAGAAPAPGGDKAPAPAAGDKGGAKAPAPAPAPAPKK
jgi:tetratricopeptide (TPR) repeat protein